MIFYFLLIISSSLLGSTLSKIFAKILIYQKGINLFPSALSSMNNVLIQEKSYDILEYALFITVSIGIFFILYFINRKRKYNFTQQALIGLSNLAFAFFVYISVLFADFSGVITIVTVVLWYSIFFIVSFFAPKEIPKWGDGKNVFYNGIFLGFFLLIFLNNLTTSVALPIATFVVVPIYFYLFSQK